MTFIQAAYFVNTIIVVFRSKQSKTEAHNEGNSSNFKTTSSLKCRKASAFGLNLPNSLILFCSLDIVHFKLQRAWLAPV